MSVPWRVGAVAGVAGDGAGGVEASAPLARKTVAQQREGTACVLRAMCGTQGLGYAVVDARKGSVREIARQASKVAKETPMLAGVFLATGGIGGPVLRDDGALPSG